jgi:hypothetical protein
VRRLEELMKHGYVERVGNAYRVTDKVSIPELQNKLQRPIDMVTETAKRLAELSARAQQARSDPTEVVRHPKTPCASQVTTPKDFTTGTGGPAERCSLVPNRGQARNAP